MRQSQSATPTTSKVANPPSYVSLLCSSFSWTPSRRHNTKSATGATSLSATLAVLSVVRDWYRTQGAY
jgi:hypothetical protein